MISKATVAQQNKKLITKPDTSEENKENKGDEKGNIRGKNKKSGEDIKKKVPGEFHSPDLKPHQNTPTSGSNEKAKKNGAFLSSQEDLKAKKTVPKATKKKPVKSPTFQSFENFTNLRLQ